MNEKQKVDAYDGDPNAKIDQKTFASVFGQAVWLMTMSNDHREFKVKELDARLAAPILLRHFKLYSKEDKPVAFLTWAGVSHEVKSKYEAGGVTLALEDWRSGPNLIVVDVIAPFSKDADIRARFFADVEPSLPHK